MTAATYKETVPAPPGARDLRAVRGEVNVRALGATGDGVTDDLAAFQAAAATGLVVVVPPPANFYRLSSGLIDLTNSIVGVGNPRIVLDAGAGTSARRVFRVADYAGKRLDIRGLVIDGSWGGGTADEHAHLIHVAGSSNVWVTECDLRNPYGDCVYVGPSEGVGPRWSTNVHVEGNTLANPRRCNVAITSGKDVFVRRNAITKPVSYVAMIDIEENVDATVAIGNIHIEGNDFDGPGEFVEIFNPNNSPQSYGRVYVRENRGSANYCVRVITATGKGQVDLLVIERNTFFGSQGWSAFFGNSDASGVGRLVLRDNDDTAVSAASPANSSWGLIGLVNPVVEGNRIKRTGSASPGVILNDCTGAKVRDNDIDVGGYADAIAIRSSLATPTSGHRLMRNRLVAATSGIRLSDAVHTDIIADDNGVTATYGMLADAAAAGAVASFLPGNTYSGTAMSGTFGAPASAVPQYRASTSSRVALPAYLAAARPNAVLHAGTLIFITDNARGKQLQYGDGTAWLQVATPLTGSTTWDPPSLASGAEQTTTLTVTGAALGDLALASFSASLAGSKLIAYVSAADTVTVVHRNDTGGAVDLASGTLRAWVIKA